MTIQLERIEKTLAALAAYGALPEGGTTRLSYGPEYLAAQEFLRGEMTAAGMQVELDPIGNLIGTYAGREPGLPAVMSGSHLDTVPAGGNFDGVLGILAALECARSWQDEGLSAPPFAAGDRYYRRRGYCLWHGLFWRAGAQRRV